MRRAWLVVLLAATTCVAATNGRNTGPWNLAELRKVPKADWLEDAGPLRSLYYAGEPLDGKPTRVFAYYAVPDKLEGKAPAMVLVHGGGGKAFPEWATLWAKRGYAALAMDLSGDGPDDKHTPDGMPDQGHHDKFFTLPKGTQNTWPYHAVAAVVRGASLLAAQPEVDPERMGITGISWGGYLTCIVAGLDDRLKVAVPVYGCGFLDENSTWLPILHKQLPPEQSKVWVENFDPSKYLGQASMPMLWVNGTNDFAYPLDSYQKSYRLPKGPRRLCVTVRMPHGHPSGWRPVEIGLFADEHLRKGTPLPRVGPMEVRGNIVTAEVVSQTPIQQAVLHVTTDTVTWNKRNWRALPAECAKGVVRATLPKARPLAFFLTVTDSRKATVSAEHAELR
ncbi:MAG: acetylxylan esterase [Candidatus Brocadiae bacterium]|nr:acetylxylan esterase [Candidatus Brocadiia bacterium]